MLERDYEYILKEHFDTSDRKSMKLLLSLNESDQNKVVASLASKLYDKIVNKVDDIDFGTIPASRGDITKIGNYLEMMECVETINEILVHYKQDTTQLEIVTTAIENIKKSKSTWMKAFAINSELPVTFYNTIVLSIVSSISLLISASIDFIKEPGDQSFTISFDRAAYVKTKDKLLFQNLEKFNKSYAKGDITKLMNSVLKANVNVKEYACEVERVHESAAIAIIAGIVGGGLLLGVFVTVVIPILHELTNLLYCIRQDVSEYFEVQAKIVQFNAEQLKYDYTKSDEEVEKIYKRQMKVVETFKKISNKLAVKINKGDAEARRRVEEERKEKYNSEDVQEDDDDITNSRDGGLF